MIRKILSLLTVAACLAASAVTDALDLEAKTAFNIAPQKLATALVEFSRQANAPVVSATQDVDRYETPGVRGTMSLKEALRALLAGTDLTGKVTDAGVIAVGAFAEEHAAESALQSPVIRVAQAHSAENPDDQVGADAPAREDAKLEEIVVTGTHIRGIRNETAPLIQFSREDLDKTGYSTTQDFIRNLPQNFSGGAAGATEDGIYGAGTGNVVTALSGANGINLRGLGDSSTLVLLNGHRIAPSAFGDVVDISMIPFSAIERVDVLTDGSSAIYGSDAVAGVVNFILNRNYDGAETRARYSAASGGARKDFLVAQSWGSVWPEGNGLLAFQYQQQDPLQADERSFTDGLPVPNDILPDVSTYSIVGSLQHEVSPAVELFADGLMSRRKITRRSQVPGSDSVNRDVTTPQSVTLNAGLKYRLADKWSLSVSGQSSELIIDVDQFNTDSDGTGISTIDGNFTTRALETVLNGTLFETRAGAANLAAGAAYREEAQDTHQVFFSGNDDDSRFRRTVKAAFAELYMPLLRSDGLIEALDLSAAVRHEHYSDFGDTTNPRVGLHLAVPGGLHFRAGYSRSFRAPTANESATGALQQLFVSSFTNPAGGADALALLIFGSRDLTAERAKTVSAGLDYEPEFIQGLQIGINYYDVQYKDRILIPPLPADALVRSDVFGSLITTVSSDEEAQAFVDAAVEAGGEFFDFGDGVAGVRYIFDVRQQNAATLDQSGLDLNVRYSKQLAARTFSLATNVALTDHIRTAFTEGATPADLLDRYGNPIGLRGRVDAGYAGANWSLNAALNYADAYTNDTLPLRPSIASWTTLDLFASLTLGEHLGIEALRGLKLDVSAQNVLNRKPPFADGAMASVNVGYDPANANPLERVIAFQIRQQW